MKLGFHYHTPTRLDNGNIFMPSHFGRFIDSLGIYCEHVTCFFHPARPDEKDLLDYMISQPNISLVDIGRRTSVLQRTLFSRQHTALVSQHLFSLDVMLIRGPSPLLPSMVHAVHPLPTTLLIVGNYLAGISDLPQPRWRKEAIRLWSYWNTKGQLRAVRKSLTFVNSRKLYNELRPYAPNLIETRTTTLTSDDFYVRADTCQKKPYHILYAGRMDRGKGLLELGQAILNLISQGEEIHFDLVGWQEKGDLVLDELKRLFEQNGFGSHLHDLGYKSVGPELFECYRNADIFVNASLASEGFPRTLWEAMANSLPVVATRVGSIPEYAGNAVELIPPRDVGALSKAISSLLHTPNRRMELISTGMELVRQNTLEVQTKKMVSEIESWLQKRK